MKLRVNADDFGATKSVTDDILDCIDAGAVNSVSIMANMPAFDYAVAEALQRPQLNIAVHLNITRGQPLSPPEDIALLVTPQGNFKYDFQGLMLAYLFAGKQQRAQMKLQLYTEFKAQLEKVKQYTAVWERKPGLDTERNIHHLPFVFEVVLKLAKEYKLNNIRLCTERGGGSFAVGGRVKWMVLTGLVKFFSFGDILQKEGIRYPAKGYFVLHKLPEALAAAKGLGFLQPGVEEEYVEIGVHPGCAAEAELTPFGYDPAYCKYLIACEHKSEKALLLQWAALNQKRS
ncbi:MAG TPA: ChbG/HpnK family deacetylase [Chitinophagales bacterium]|nr:ChbG/HpnK family deacetylase [Chitinophagales bacterium]